MVSSIKAKMPAKEHTDNCANLAIAKRCDKCRKLYENEKKRRQRKEISDKKYKTRCAKKKSESKYAHVLCDECRDNKRTKTYLCKKCKLPSDQKISIGPIANPDPIKPEPIR